MRSAYYQRRRKATTGPLVGWWPSAGLGKLGVTPRGQPMKSHICSSARTAVSILSISLAVALPARASSAEERTEMELPEKYRKSPFALMSLSIGSPTDGWQIRAKKLKASTDLWIQDKSVPYSYGHPALVLMLHRTAKQLARQSPGSVLLVGDLSREFGGPLKGHRSHQSGRDADVGFFVTDREGKPLRIRRLLRFDKQGKARDNSGLRFDDYRNWLLVQLWLKDSRAELEHVFVASHLRRRLLDFARDRPSFRHHVAGAAQFLRQPTNGLPHDDHFHVRIACPERQQSLCETRLASR
jgi:penicillin-insensitive murein endopeptidase